ncbi:MAG: 16S rRNA (uracil(1498)-N(3))-methyltransferase [Phycisphaerales bacterium]
MARHTLVIDDRSLPDQPGSPIAIEGDEAKHAIRVKRVAEGDIVRVLNGKGLVLITRVTEARRTLHLAVESVEEEPRPSVTLQVATATPKGPRLDKMIDMLSQVGASAWHPLSTKYGVVEPGANKIDRMERICRESAKQALRAWPMQIGAPLALSDALETEAGERLVIADASGGEYQPGGPGTVRALVGPEGGWTSEELDAAQRAGAQVVGLGPHVLRIETAAVVLASTVVRSEAAT